MNPAAASIRVLLCALALGPAVACAQMKPLPPIPNAPAPWVQVEVLVFRHLDGTLAADEAWPAEPALAYPEPIRILVTPGSPAHSAALAAREFEQTLAAEEGSAAIPVTVEELPFVRLARSDTVLGEKAARLAGASAYRLLDHLAWRQPLPAPSRPVSVLITAGTQAGTHYEVEGSLTLSRARYLHADITLWLNDLDAGAGTQGLLLPEVPLPREPVPSSDGVAVDPAAPGEDADAAMAQEPAEAPIEAEPVRSRRTVVIHTARRLAQGEVHYLDHPLFGVLLVARAWDPATGTAVADEEGAAQGAEGAESTPPPEGAEQAPPPEGAEEAPPPD